MGDCISRQAVLDMVEDMTDQFGNKHRVVTEGMINLLPPVTPKPKTGHWILSGGYWRCSECKEKALLKLDKAKGNCKEYIPIKSNICPNCGVKMLESQEREDLADNG